MAGLALVREGHVARKRHAQQLERDGQVSQFDFSEVRIRRRLRLGRRDDVGWRRRRSSDEVDETGRKFGDVDVERLAASPNRHLLF